MQILPNYDLSGNGFDPNAVRVVSTWDLGPIPQLYDAAVDRYMRQIRQRPDRGVVQPGQELDLFAAGYMTNGNILYCNMGIGAAAVIDPRCVQTLDNKVRRAITIAVDDPNRGAGRESWLGSLIRNLSPF
ncbi:hypothetical protein HYV82_03695 [Candidatus Woesearchaeota archaeon]|nr:hypothetical protein [Candidatus Woesearchaeota archaeon]